MSPPPFSISVLGSGSRGNCTVLIFDIAGRRACALVDCGLSVRATRRHLSSFGLDLEDITDILITHFDRDHVQPRWFTVAEACNIRVRVHRAHRHDAQRRGVSRRVLHLYDNTTDIADRATVTAIQLAHDASGSVGFVINTDEARLGYATDLGRVPQHLLDAFTNLDVLAIESNYDDQMQWASDRPWFLKQRVTGGRGHLSNHEALDAVRHIAATSHLSRILLLHLSQECNCPDLVRRLYTRRARAIADRVVISRQRTPTPLIPIQRGPAHRGPAPTPRQLMLFTA